MNNYNHGGMIIMDKYNIQAYILTNWEQDWDCKTKYYTVFPDGNVLWYDFETDSFYLHYDEQQVPYDKAIQMMQILV
jgi:hypothetical protein